MNTKSKMKTTEPPEHHEKHENTAREIDQIQLFALEEPSEDRIFAGSLMGFGEDRGAYLDLYRRQWAALAPQDPYEADLLAQFVNYLWTNRRVLRMVNQHQMQCSAESFIEVVSDSGYARRHWWSKNDDDADNATGDDSPATAPIDSNTEYSCYTWQGQKLMEQVRVDSPKARAKAKQILSVEGQELDAGSLKYFASEPRRMETMHNLVDETNDRAEACIQRLLKYRKRKARLQRFLISDKP